jgi:hypothetical protein
MTAAHNAHEILDAAPAATSSRHHRRPREPIVVRVRKLTAVAALAGLALGVGGLTACDSKVGQAAIVDGHRISESDLGDYVTPAGASASVLAAASSANQHVYPKTEVVQLLVQQRLFERALAKNGGVPSEGELAKLHDQAASTFLGTQLAGKQLDDYLAKQQGSYGYSARYAKLLLRTVELEGALAVKIRARSLAELSAAVNKLHLRVQVNPRYGKWSPKTLSLGAPDSDLPDFLKLKGASTPAPSPPAAG